jgi:hypothetical protein
MKQGWQRLILIIGVAALGVLLLAAPADAQCSMCRAALAGTDGAFIRNFNIGVLVLLVPPVAIFCSIFLVLRRHRNSLESGVVSLESKVEGSTSADYTDSRNNQPRS